VADPFVAEIRIFPFNFPPKGWAFCDGQLLPISQNTALFSLLGTNYGGDGKSTFALPNLQGAAAMHPNSNSYPLGAMGGSQTVTLDQSEMPVHTHNLMVTTGLSTSSAATPTSVLARAVGGFSYKATPFVPLAQMAVQALSPTGGSLPHNNMMPFITFNYNIAMQGVYPPRP
jgi:microcystin-dependent protein